MLIQYLAFWASIACVHSTKHVERDMIDVDVAVVGGGASGSYAAVRLREDYRKTVLVIEKSNRLGGHVQVFQPPNGDRPVNYGVQAYLNRATTISFFKRFGVKLVDPELTDYIDLILQSKNVDFTTGMPVNVNYGPLDLLGVPISLLRYFTLAVKYQPWFENGYFGRGRVPRDLLLPFGEFLKKHDLSGSLGVLRSLLWLSDAINTPTWAVMAVVGQPQISAFGLGLLGPSFKWPETYSSATLYDRVLELLGDDVLLESTVASCVRDGDGVKITVQTPSGERSVRAKKILFAATPSPDNVDTWDLDETENQLFSKFSWERLYVGIVNNTGLESGITGIRNAPNNQASFYLPSGDFTDAYDRVGTTDMWTTRVIGQANLTESEARSLMVQSLRQMQEASTYEIDEPSIIAFASHGLTAPKVSPEELRDGFYNKLYALQGRRRTFWTGLAWAPDYTPILWDYTEKLFDGIVRGL